MTWIWYHRRFFGIILTPTQTRWKPSVNIWYHSLFYSMFLVTMYFLQRSQLLHSLMQLQHVSINELPNLKTQKYLIQIYYPSFYHTAQLLYHSIYLKSLLWLGWIINEVTGSTGFNDSLERQMKWLAQMILQIQPIRKSGVAVSWSKATHTLSIIVLILFSCTSCTCEPQQMLSPATNVPANVRKSVRGYA